MSFAGLGVVTFLIGECFRGQGRAIYGIGALREAMGFPQSRETLRKELRQLKSDGWIDFDVRERQRKPYVFELGLRLTSASSEGRSVGQSEGHDTQLGSQKGRHTHNTSEPRQEIEEKPEPTPLNVVQLGSGRGSASLSSDLFC